MHGKILMVDNLQKKGEDDLICKLCNNEQENPRHLYMQRFAPTQKEFGQSSAGSGTHHHRLVRTYRIQSTNVGEDGGEKLKKPKEKSSTV